MSTFSETMTGMEFMVRDRLNLLRSPDLFLADDATGGLCWADAELTLVAEDVEAEESLLGTKTYYRVTG